MDAPFLEIRRFRNSFLLGPRPAGSDVLAIMDKDRHGLAPHSHYLGVTLSNLLEPVFFLKYMLFMAVELWNALRELLLVFIEDKSLWAKEYG